MSSRPLECRRDCERGGIEIQSGWESGRKSILEEGARSGGNAWRCFRRKERSRAVPATRAAVMTTHAAALAIGCTPKRKPFGSQGGLGNIMEQKDKARSS